MTDTEPLDLDAVNERWIDWYNGTSERGDWSRLDHEEEQSHYLAREDVPALIDEVHRLRELQEDTAAENARLSAWWHAMRRGGLA